VHSKEISVFAITKNGRRYEDVNYISRQSAEKRIEKIIASMRSIAGKHFAAKFDIVETVKPNKVW
tara:strand:- start:2811 stop:3005 length:195 start_codon:yes stop_codon:yes gene_type:complete